MAYSEKVIDHYENPRNVGSFAKGEEGVATGMVGAPACGDVMKLQIKVNKDGVIEDAKFKTYGCGSAIASSSLVTEWVKGKTRRRGRHHPEHADRRGAGAAAGEDPLLDPRRGRDQGGGRGLPQEVRHARRLRHRPGEEGGRLMAITLTDRAAQHVQRYIEKRGKGVGVRLGVKTTGCSGLAYKLEFADAIQRRGPGVREQRRARAGRPEEPRLPRRHRARLRARGAERGLQVQQPEREGPLRLRGIVQRVVVAAPARAGANSPRDALGPGLAPGRQSSRPNVPGILP